MVNIKTLVCFGVATLSHVYSLAQTSYEHGVPYYPIPVKGHHYIDIQYLEINKNQFFLNEIKKYIVEQADSSALFKSGFGFLRVDNIKTFSNNPYFLRNQQNGEHSKDISFRIGMRSYLLTQSWVTAGSYCSGCFPDFYSIVDGRLILIYNDQTGWLHQGYYSEESKARLTSLQEKHLKQALDPGFTFTDLFGKTFQLSPQERARLTEREILLQASLTLQSGKTVIQYLDGQVKYQY